MIEEIKNYEGRQDHIKDLATPAIEVFRNIYSERDYTVDLEIPEFTAICPKTGLPDFGIIYISYIPDEYCLELKSLKEYFFFFRDIGIFHENVVNKSMDDIIKYASPRKLLVHADYNIRGGIETRVSAEYEKK